MHPVLFQAFGVSVPSYGFMLALSFLAGTILAAWLARREGLEPTALIDYGIWIIIGAIVGARLYYFFLHFERFQDRPWEALNPFASEGGGFDGLVFFGGLGGGVLASFLYFRFKHYSFPRYMDVVAPSIALGVVLTRIGCFLNGCCFGKPARGPLSVPFPPGSAAGHYQEQVQAAGLHPSQLYEALGGLGLLVLLLAAGGSWKRWPGVRFYGLVALYSVLRFVVDFTRHYRPDEMAGPLSHNQVVSLVLLAASGTVAVEAVLRRPPLAVGNSAESSSFGNQNG